MPFPAIASLLGASTVVGGHVTKQFVLSGARSGLGQFAQSLPFGAGYSLGTYLGFPKNYQGGSTRYYSSTRQYNMTPMPYTRYGRWYPSRYSRYRRRRRYYRRY